MDYHVFVVAGEGSPRHIGMVYGVRDIRDARVEVKRMSPYFGRGVFLVKNQDFMKVIL